MEWSINRFTSKVIQLTSGLNALALHAEESGSLDFQEHSEPGEETLIWSGDVANLYVSKTDDGNVKMEFTQKNNSFVIALFNGLHPAFFDEMKARQENIQKATEDIMKIADRPPAAPAAGGGRKTRKMSKKYCKKTACKRMGFSQKASCRPYKNCYQ